MVRMTLGDKIKKAMEDVPLSRSEFSQALGVSNATLTRWFNNQNPPSDQHFVMICSGFLKERYRPLASKRNLSR